MWKVPAPVLCLTTLPLLGCAGNYAASPAAAVPPSRPVASTPYSYAAAPRVYTAGPAAPAAILVFLPGADVVASDPTLWEAQGFDVVMPPADFYRLGANEQAAMTRLLAAARAMTEVPIWLVGPSQTIEAAIPQLGGISGVVVTAGGAPTVTCSESFSYYDPGTGALPQVQVGRSGNCGPGFPGGSGGQSTIVQPPQAPRHNASPLIEASGKAQRRVAPWTRIIEASAVGKNLPPAAQVRRLAELIKGVPSS